MKIQIYFLVYLLLLIAVSTWQHLFPSYEFLQTSCIVGEASFPEGNKQIVECSACATHADRIHRKGTIQIRVGTHQQINNRRGDPKQSMVYAAMYLQRQCIEYQCKDIINQKDFQNQKFMKNASLQKAVNINQKIDQKAWDVFFYYDNHLKNQQSGIKQYKMRLLNYIFGPFVPFSTLPFNQYSNGLALKLRYDIPLQTNIQDISKPIIKMTVQPEKTTQLILIGFLFSVLAAVKLKIFSSKNDFDIKIALICCSFVNPYLFSIICLIVKSVANVSHVISLFLYICCLIFDFPSGIMACIITSSLLQLKLQNKSAIIQTTVCFNFLIGLAFFLDISSIIKMSPVILFAFFLEPTENSYQKIGNETKKIDRSVHQMIEVEPQQ